MADKKEGKPLLERDAKPAAIEGRPVLATDDESKPQLLDRLQLGFPVYAVDYSAATSTLFVAGGGGPAKTGVRNSIVERFGGLLMFLAVGFVQIVVKGTEGAQGLRAAMWPGGPDVYDEPSTGKATMLSDGPDV